MVFLLSNGAGALGWGSWPVATSPFLSPGTVAVIDISTQLVINICCYAVPVLLSPLVVVILRPLFALFLREGTGLFTEEKKSKLFCEAAAHYIAIVNVITFLVAWSATFSCCLLHGPHLVMVGLEIAGVAAGLAITIYLVHEMVELTWDRAIVVGLVTFGGGNLPLIIGLPLFWLLR